MTTFNIKFLLICLSAYVFSAVFCSSNEPIYGKDLKQQASTYFETIGLEANILVSDRRAFFFCSTDLKFTPRIKNDWRTIEAICETENWQSILRTNSRPPGENILGESYSGSTSEVISLAKNMSKGQVISEDDLILVEVPQTSNFESFSDFEQVIGKKITNNLAKGTVLKARHVKYTMTVNKNDTVLVVLGNEKISITTIGIALASGQNGDMISVENLNSKKIFKAIIIGEKKVAPLANM
jgi:flagella basal body P-ring formation protein FlgA